MSRYAAMFEGLRTRHEAAFGAFAMLGDPMLGSTFDSLDRLVRAGADMLEVGLPFSDPVADGPVIQAAAQRALASGFRTDDGFSLIADFRARHPDVPVGILTYANIVAARGRDAFFADAVAAGADSLLVADVGSVEAEPWATEMISAGLDPVLIAAPNMSDGALHTVASIGRGYTYCITRAGITGTHAGARFDSALLDRLRHAGAPPPVFGFGIARAEQVRAAVAAGAAGAISGSAIVSCAAEGGDVPGLVGQLKSGTRNESAS